MARMDNFLNGKLSGTLGNVAFRQVNGKTIVVRKTKSFIPGTDSESIGRRTRFGIAVKLAQAIYSIPELKKLWQNSTPRKKSTYNFILRSNLKLISDGKSLAGGNLTVDAILLAPGFTFNVEVVRLAMSTDSIEVQLNPLVDNSDIDPHSEPKAKIVTLVCLGDPVNNSLDRFKFSAYPSAPIGSEARRCHGIHIMFRTAGRVSHCKLPEQENFLSVDNNGCRGRSDSPFEYNKSRIKIEH